MPKCGYSGRNQCIEGNLQQWSQNEVLRKGKLFHPVLALVSGMPFCPRYHDAMFMPSLKKQTVKQDEIANIDHTPAHVAHGKKEPEVHDAKAEVADDFIEPVRPSTLNANILLTRCSALLIGRDAAFWIDFGYTSRRSLGLIKTSTAARPLKMADMAMPSKRFLQ